MCDIKKPCDKSQSDDTKNGWIVSYKETPAGRIPIISSKWKAADVMGNIMVRWSSRRMDYIISPEAYGVGNPDSNSPVFVTSNYKLTFDILRRDLEGINGWILVLDTKGINVWCAAGKGTFGTQELVKRFFLSKIDLLVNHKTLIVPQLGAVGVSAFEVKGKTGFKVIFGPVRSKDIAGFIENNCKKSEKMTRVFFGVKDRIILTPMELISSVGAIIVFLLVSGIFSVIQARGFGLNILTDFIPYFGAFIVGAVLFPVLLPYIPSRSFAIKGFILGIAYSLIISAIYHFPLLGTISTFLILPVIVSFLALNFTGATTFTSMTGAKLEVKLSLPVYIALAVIGITVKIFSVVKVFFA
jgi:hypothetical protein